MDPLFHSQPCHSQSRLDNLPEKPILFLLCRWIQQSFFFGISGISHSLTHLLACSLLFPNRYLQPQHFNLWLFLDSMNFRLHSLSSSLASSARICSNLNSINWINDWQKLIKSDSNNWLLALVVYITLHSSVWLMSAVNEMWRGILSVNFIISPVSSSLIMSIMFVKSICWIFVRF